MINSLVPGRINIGRIDLLPAYSLFDVEKGSAKKVVAALKGNEFYGHRIYAEVATDKDYVAKGKGKRKSKESNGYGSNDKHYGNSRKSASNSRFKQERHSAKPHKNKKK